MGITPVTKLPSSQRLTWEDFKGIPEEDKNFDAFTYWRIDYIYTLCNNEDGQMIINELDICVFLEERSWVKHKSDKLLNHEQGHLNIGMLCALAFKRRLQRCTFSSDKHEEEIAKIFNLTLEEYRTLEKQYDEDTDRIFHGDRQEFWDIYIQQRLSEINVNLLSKISI